MDNALEAVGVGTASAAASVVAYEAWRRSVEREIIMGRPGWSDEARAASAEAKASKSKPWQVIDTDTGKPIYSFATAKEARSWASVHNADEAEGSGRKKRYTTERAVPSNQDAKIQKINGEIDQMFSKSSDGKPTRAEILKMANDGVAPKERVTKIKDAEYILKSTYGSVEAAQKRYQELTATASRAAATDAKPRAPGLPPAQKLNKFAYNRNWEDFDREMSRKTPEQLDAMAAEARKRAEKGRAKQTRGEKAMASGRGKGFSASNMQKDGVYLEFTYEETAKRLEQISGQKKAEAKLKSGSGLRGTQNEAEIPKSAYARRADARHDAMISSVKRDQADMEQVLQKRLEEKRKALASIDEQFERAKRLGIAIPERVAAEARNNTTSYSTIKQAEEFKRFVDRKAKKLAGSESSSLRGTQNEANLEAIIENRKENAKPKARKASKSPRSNPELVKQLAERFKSVIEKPLSQLPEYGKPETFKPAKEKLATYSQLAAEIKAANLSKADAHALAKAVGNDWIAPSATGKRALNSVIHRVQAGMNHMAKTLATGGRSVASIAGPLAIVGAAAVAYDATRNSARAAGDTDAVSMGKAAAAGVAAGGTIAGIGYGLAKGAELAMKAAPAVGRVAARAIPVAAIAWAGWEIGKGAYEGAKTGGFKGAVKGAGTGALDFATAGAYSHFTTKSAPTPHLTADQAEKYKTASENYVAMQSAKVGPEMFERTRTDWRTGEKITEMVKNTRRKG